MTFRLLLVLTLLLTRLAAGQSPFDPTGEEVYHQGPKQIRIQVEWIEVSHAQYTDLLSGDQRSSNHGPLRAELGRLIKTREAKMVESMQVVTRSGQRAKSESVQELIYPAEYSLETPAESVEPTNTPAEEGTEAEPGEDEQEKAPASPSGMIFPTAFETRNVGATLEVDPVLDEDGRTIDLSLAPEIIYHVGDAHWGTARSVAGSEVEIKLPTFFSMKATTAATLIDGEYTLLATSTPPGEDGKVDPSRKVLVFVRAQILALGRPAKPLPSK